MDTRLNTTSGQLSAFGRRSGAVETAFLTLNFALFVFAIADWRGWLPFERGFEPLRTVYLSGGLVLLPSASLIRRRSMVVHFLLLAVSVALFVTAMSVHS